MHKDRAFCVNTLAICERANMAKRCLYKVVWVAGPASAFLSKRCQAQKPLRRNSPLRAQQTQHE
eukprot:12132749-Alexandrium_andersonii.AAC.1